jgi:hypothetical protein
MTPRFITPRLTAPQLAVLRALDALPEGEWITAKEGGFHTVAATKLQGREPNPIAHRQEEHHRPPRGSSWRSLYHPGSSQYQLSPAGRALVARLKAEGAL